MDTTKNELKDFSVFLRKIRMLGGGNLVEGHATCSILGLIHEAYLLAHEKPDMKVLNLFASRDNSGFRESVYHPLFQDVSYYPVDFWHDKFIYQEKELPNSYTLPFLDNTFDIVMTTKVILEHISDPQATINEIKRVLKSGGVAYLIAPFITIAHQGPYDYFRYTEFGLRHILTKAGFEILSITRSNSDFLTATEAILMFNISGILPASLARLYNKINFGIIMPLAKIVDPWVRNQGRFPKYYLCKVRKP